MGVDWYRIIVVDVRIGNLIDRIYAFTYNAPCSGLHWTALVVFTCNYKEKHEVQGVYLTTCASSDQ